MKPYGEGYHKWSRLFNMLRTMNEQIQNIAQEVPCHANNITKI